MSVGVLDHYNVSTRKLDETLHFYKNVLGFSVLQRHMERSSVELTTVS